MRNSIVDGVRRGTYDNGTYEVAADRFLITVACPVAAATAGGGEDTLPVGCYRDTQAHGHDGTYVCYALMTEDAAQRLILDGPSGGRGPDDTPARR